MKDWGFYLRSAGLSMGQAAQAMAEMAEHARRLTATAQLMSATFQRRETAVVTGHDGVSRVVVR